MASNVEESQFRRTSSGGFLDIVKKGYARDAGQPSASSLGIGLRNTVLAPCRVTSMPWDPSSLTASSCLGLSRCKLVFL